MIKKTENSYNSITMVILVYSCVQRETLYWLKVS